VSENAVARVVDRSRFGSGPWDNEPDRVEWRDEKTGLDCLIVRGPLGALCGYVAVLPGHPWHGRGYDDVDADVHGGLTYAAACHGLVCHVPRPGEPDDVWWLGFDAAHYMDLVPSMSFWRKEARFEVAFDETYKGVDYMKNECADLARQVSEASLVRQARRLIDA
jgi:hypothetical protein